MAYVIKDKEGHPITTKDGVSILGMDNHEGLELEDFSDKERSFLAVANAESEDRFKDVIMAKGWQLENYRKNPVVMAFHNYGTLPVGRSLEEFVKKRKGVNNLFFRPQFAAYPDTIRMYEMYRDKYLKGFSVGFMPIKEEPIKQEEDKEKKSLFFHEPTRYLIQELLENSVAPIPAHPDALAEIKGMVQKGQIYIPARYLQEEQGTEMEVYDKYIHVKFADEDKFLDLYIVGMTEGISRVFGHQKDEDKNELFDYKFIFSKDTYSEDQVVDLAEMLSKEKYEAKEFQAYDPEKYSAREPVMIELLDSLEDKDFTAEKKEEDKLEDLVISEDIDFEEVEYIEKDEVEKPYPDEHACRLKDPDKYDKFARKNCWRKSDGKCIDYIFGIKAGKSDAQALRYKKDIWTASAAKSHCKGAGGTFEAAGEAAVFNYLVCTVCDHWEGYRDEENPKCPKCKAEMVASNEKVYKEKETFKCECIDCGHKVTSSKHCDAYKCPECGGTMRRVERPGPGKEYEEIADNVYVYHTEEHLKDGEEITARIIEQFKEVFGEEAKLMIVDGGAKFGKLGELNFDIELTKELIDEIVERVVKAVKGIVRKEKIEVEEDGTIIELEEPEEAETFDLDKDVLKEMVSDSFKGVLGQLD